jgi:nucleoside-diphosphate-sugar epimerase
VSGDHLRRFISVGSSLETLNAQTGQPHGAYGKAKLKELQQLRKTAAKLGAAFSPTRTHYVYGPLQSPKKLIPMAIKAAQEGQPLKLTAPEISKRLIYVGDIIDALLQIPNQPASPDNVQLITSDQNTSNLEVVHQISKLMAKPIQIKLGEFSHREFDQPTWDISDAGSRLANWTAKTSLPQGLQYCIDATELANV